MTPKISVLIPLYNRKQYAADCVGSVLNQSFRDFELIIRDDFSTDGVFDFVRENFSDSRIKFYRNEKNFGEAETIIRLARDAAGKYFTILHNDDLYLPNALQNFYETAEKFGADVVHGANFLDTDSAKLAGKNILRKISFDKNPARKAEVVPGDSNSRFSEWFGGKIFRDLQYNIFRRNFILDEKIFADLTKNNLLMTSLKWIMRAKVLVKTPETFYIRRDNPYSQTHAHSNLENEISKRIEFFRWLEKFIAEFEFFRNNDELQYKIKARIFSFYENLDFDNSSAYGNEKYLGVYNSIEDTFRKYFGDDAVYLAMTYHWAHSMHYNQNQFSGTLRNSLKLLERNI